MYLEILVARYHVPLIARLECTSRYSDNRKYIFSQMKHGLQSRHPYFVWSCFCLLSSSLELAKSSIVTRSSAIRIRLDIENLRSEIAFLVSILYSVIDSDNSLSKWGLSTSIFFGGFNPASSNTFAKEIRASVRTPLAILSEIDWY